MPIFQKYASESECDVLVLDNEELIRVVTMAFLEDAHFYACEAADGAQALTLLDKVPCRILLTDIQLGPYSFIRDGREVARIAMQRHPDLAVIYSSGSPIDLGRPLGPRERALVKPFRPQRLLDAVRELLMAQRSSVPAE